MAASNDAPCLRTLPAALRAPRSNLKMHPAHPMPAFVVAKVWNASAHVAIARKKGRPEAAHSLISATLADI
jgi:hypothetical protein